MSFFVQNFLLLGYQFDFMLEKGKKLVSGTPLENNEGCFAKSIVYAIDVAKISL
ncbi:hypothetical protein ABIB40_003174 [Pedobacter sp. UYP30]